MTGTGVALLFCTSGPASGSLLDVRDPRGFVAACIQKSWVRPSAEQREDLIAEGLMILCGLAARYEPHREGYAQPGRFSGYAARYLPLRMQDAWQQMNPTVTNRDAESGTREVEFLEHASLNVRVHADLTATYGLAQSFDTLGAALDRVPEPWCASNMHRRVVEGLGAGLGVVEIARELGVKRNDVVDIRSAVASAICEVREMEAA
jgi:hypothetical protein